MAQVTVFECEHCGKYLKTKKGYNTHVEEHEEQIRLKAEEQQAQEFDRDEPRLQEPRLQDRDEPRLQAENVEHFIELVKEAINERLKSEGNGTRLIDLDVDVNYINCASNSHSCPKDGVTNWSEHYPDRPRGYPAYAGRVWVAYSSSPGTFSGGSLLQYFRLHTGSGGYGSCGDPKYKDYLKDGYYCLSYDCTIWLDDLPKVREKILSLVDEKEAFETFAEQEQESLDFLIDSSEEVSDYINEVASLRDMIEKLSEEMRETQDNLYQKKQEILQIVSQKSGWTDRQRELISKADKMNARGVLVGLPSLEI